MKKTKVILIVEDEKDIREAMRDALRDAGYDVLEAENGNVGLSAAFQHHPHLILLDLLMPEMDGMTMLKHLREDAWGKTAAVIILTNLNATKEHIIEDMVTHQPLEYLIKSDWKIYDVLKKIGTILEAQK